MIVKSSEADRIARNPPRGLIAALVFGPDSGLARERSEILLKTVVEDLSDPFRVSDLDEQTLANDPARLYDEAASISMLGGRRVVRVRSASNALAKLFEAFLAEPAGDALVVVEAGDLAKGSALRSVFEAADNAAAIPCYLDSARELSDVVRDALKAGGLSIAPDALEDAVSRLGSDRGVTRRELEKLVLYARGQKQVTLEDVRASMGDEAEARIEEACDVSPVAVLRQAMSHFQRLLLVGAAREGAEEAIKRLRPPLHFSRVSAFKSQAQKWNSARLVDALDLLFEGEALCKTTGVPAEAVCGRAMFNVAAMGRMR